MNSKQKRRKSEYQKGFTLAELLIVVAIIGVLVAVAVPVFTNQLEKSRESVDLANVRSAYAQVMTAAMTEDTSSTLHLGGGLYLASVPLKQKVDNWQSAMDGVSVGGVASSDHVHWLHEPKAGGNCKVYYDGGQVFIDWGTENHINQISAAEFLTKDILQSIVGDTYSYSVINSNETSGQGGGTAKFLAYAASKGLNLADYGANTWQIYVKESGTGGDFLSNPAIYWSTVKVTSETYKTEHPTYIPVMGYRDGKYDVYRAEVVVYNEGKATQYYSMKNNFANVTNAGGSASFQFSNYEDAKAAYDTLLAAYEANGGTVPNSAMSGL